MSSTLVDKPPQVIEYPESDGQPIAENTLQFRWIMTIKGGFDAVFADDANVFVAGDLLWYPVEGDPAIRQAPDIMIALGRPKGDRGSYMQWKEDGIAPQVVFEILSPGNRLNEMTRKHQFYERYGVEEYYIYDPDRGELFGWQRSDGLLKEVPKMEGWTSPRLRTRFELVGGEIFLIGPDGHRFATYLELIEQRKEAEHETELLKREKDQALREVERLRAQLKALGIKPDV
jgi:Uma2 family endonuclease